MIKNILGKFGYSINKIAQDEEKQNLYHTCLKTLLFSKETITVVIVGANDGKINDPIYDFIKVHPSRFKIILVEPNAALIPILEENYKFHPAKIIANCAVGYGESITLFSIKKDYWPRCQPAYAKQRNWPEYRAPTGVTSSHREHVIKYIRKYLPTTSEEEAIEEFIVPCMELSDLLDSSGSSSSLDVLQIDAEGADDQVLYSSNIEETKPTLIYFEIKNMSMDNKTEITDWLANLGYFLINQGGDVLAIKADIQH